MQNYLWNIRDLKRVTKSYFHLKKLTSLCCKNIAIFYHIETLHKIHGAMLEGLSKIDIESEKAWIELSDLFCKIIPQMRSIYSQFFQNYDTAVLTLNSMKENENFKLELDKLESNERAKGKDLLSHLTEPTQKVFFFFL